jgi:hypothetical protein
MRLGYAVSAALFWRLLAYRRITRSNLGLVPSSDGLHLIARLRTQDHCRTWWLHMKSWRSATSEVFAVAIVGLVAFLTGSSTWRNWYALIGLDGYFMLAPMLANTAIHMVARPVR